VGLYAERGRSQLPKTGAGSETLWSQHVTCRMALVSSGSFFNASIASGVGKRSNSTEKKRLLQPVCLLGCQIPREAGQEQLPRRVAEVALINVTVVQCKTVLCGEPYRSALEQRSGDWVLLRVIAANQIGQRRLPDVAHAQPLAQVHIAVGVHVDSLGTEQVLVRAGCEFLTRAHWEPSRKLLRCTTLEQNTASNNWFPSPVLGSLSVHARWVNADRAAGMPSCCAARWANSALRSFLSRRWNSSSLTLKSTIPKSRIGRSQCRPSSTEVAQ